MCCYQQLQPVPTASEPAVMIVSIPTFSVKTSELHLIVHPCIVHWRGQDCLNLLHQICRQMCHPGSTYMLMVHITLHLMHRNSSMRTCCCTYL